MRIKWSRLLVALLILVLFVYGGAVLLGLPGRGRSRASAPSPAWAASWAAGRPRPARPPPPLRRPPAPPQAPTAAPTAAAPRRQPHRPPPLPPAPHRPRPAPTATARPQQQATPGPGRGVPLGGGGAGVAGAVPPGLRHRGLRQGVPPYAPVVLLYQEKLAEKRGLGVRFVPFDIEDKNRISEQRRAELLQSGGFDVLLTTMNSYALYGEPADGGHHRHRRRVRRGGQGHRAGQRGGHLQRPAGEGGGLLGQQRERVPAVLHAAGGRRPGGRGDPLRPGEPQPGRAPLPGAGVARGGGLVERRPDPGRAAGRQPGADGLRPVPGDHGRGGHRLPRPADPQGSRAGLPRRLVRGRSR